MQCEEQNENSSASCRWWKQPKKDSLPVCRALRQTVEMFPFKGALELNSSEEEREHN